MRISKFNQLFLYFTLILGFCSSAIAETVYVSDNLRVGVRPEPDNGYTPVGVVTTGMKLEVLDNQKGYLKIKTDDGLIGWIKDIYVIDKAPAIIKLQRLQKKHTDLVAKAKEMRETLSALESANHALNEQVDKLKAERSRLQLLQAKSVSTQQKERSTWYWWIIALAVVIASGFFGGIQWNRHQAMKRLGGLRV